MTDTPIADYALISDCHSAALVGRDGSIDWLCFPRFDRPSVFGRILGDDAGHFRVGPAGPHESIRRYLDRSMVLETTFRTPSGLVVLVDAMALAADGKDHDLGAGAPGTLLRRIECTEGTVKVVAEYAPRPEYGLVAPLLTADGGSVAGRGGAEVLLLSAPEGAAVDGATSRWTLSLRAGESAAFALDHAWADEPPPRAWDAEEIEAGLTATVEGWAAWSSAHQAYEGPWAGLVYHSGRVLQALTYQPTGAIVAAPTTSLPETVGGSRNWDYRYAWVRDASFTLDALWVAACPDEANTFFSWITGAVASGLHEGLDLQIMFGVRGEHDLTERELPHLDGWRDSRPVRVGNGAWDQRQLDVYGELLDAALRLEEQLGDLDDATKGFLIALVDAAASRWGDTDSGIWEVRGGARHFVYSKVMCWVALDRGVRLAPLLGAGDRVAEWEGVRDEIRTAILEQGWSERAGAFTQSFGSDELDASNLMLPIVGFLPADDPRMLATIEAIEEHLTDDRGLVYRYRADDGLPGEEGTFLLCTFWLAEALALAGRAERATATFERAIAYANDVGLLSEEVDGESGELLGNFPQAFSHIGLINAAWAISQAGRGDGSGGRGSSTGARSRS